MDQVERHHWYYVGKRQIVEYWIKRCRPLASNDILLDFGAGTGLFASGFMGQCKVRVYDSYPESQAILKERFPAECVLDSKGPRIPLEDASVGCITALDVLEHLKDDAGIVLEFQRVLSPSGLIVITVPADMKLWSDWDVSLFHYRRYNRAELLALFDPEKFRIIKVCYKNVFAYPAIYFLRKLRKWTGRINNSQGNRAEDQVPSRWVNSVLKFLYTAPAKATWFSPPFGVSLLLVAQKR